MAAVNASYNNVAAQYVRDRQNGQAKKAEAPAPSGASSQEPAKGDSVSFSNRLGTGVEQAPESQSAKPNAKSGKKVPPGLAKQAEKGKELPDGNPWKQVLDELKQEKASQEKKASDAKQAPKEAPAPFAPTPASPSAPEAGAKQPQGQAPAGGQQPPASTQPPQGLEGIIAILQQIMAKLGMAEQKVEEKATGGNINNQPGQTGSPVTGAATVQAQVQQPLKQAAA